MLRVLYHIGKDTKYIANKQECNRFFAPSRVEVDTTYSDHTRQDNNIIYLTKERIYGKKTNDAFGRNLPLRRERDGSDEC